MGREIVFIQRTIKTKSMMRFWIALFLTGLAMPLWSQTANFRLPADRDPGTVMEYLNRYLPEDIQVLSCARAPEAFHSRLSAVRKTYRYQIEMGPRRNVFQRNYYYGLGCGLD